MVLAANTRFCIIDHSVTRDESDGSSDPTHRSDCTQSLKSCPSALIAIHDVRRGRAVEWGWRRITSFGVYSNDVSNKERGSIIVEGTTLPSIKIRYEDGAGPSQLRRYVLHVSDREEQ